MAKRILIVNKFYYNRGGDCIVAMNTERLLQENGYDVGFFAMKYSENNPTRFSEYFAEEVNFSSGLTGKIQGLRRTLGLGNIRTSFTRILDDFKPDVVHLNNIHSYLSPVLAQMAHKRGIRVVWTLHDYKLLCPSYACLRNGKPCELCYNDKGNVTRYRCMKGSRAASLIAWLEAKKWNRQQLEKFTHAFICPSKFMAGKMAQGGFDTKKLQVLCNFVDSEKLVQFKKNTVTHRDDYYCYVGRLSVEKGIETLLNAAAQFPHELRVAGDGPLAERLRKEYGRFQHIKFLGRVNAQEVSGLLSHARFSVVPSEWYENNPLSVIESLCSGTPVVGSDIGGIPELIAAGESGITYPYGSETDLKGAIEEAWDKAWNYTDMKARSLERFSPEAHLDQLLKIYRIR